MIDNRPGGGDRTDPVTPGVSPPLSPRPGQRPANFITRGLGEPGGGDRTDPVTPALTQTWPAPG